jgi:mRNA interferase RelE/StbE
MESPGWQLELTQHARHDLKRLSPDMRGRIVSAIDGLTTIPRRGDIKNLRGGTNDFRLRVGDWRVTFGPNTERRMVVILSVSHRSAAYRN